ncbi:MAG TPA: hypothetical protein VNL14_21390 [Candidatus Acidoferrales bacterium]|nr:hypothetical protein [Candidatus Acidoferrales bacterium]
MKADTLLLLETVAAVVYAIAAMGLSIYVMDALMVDYQRTALIELDSLFALY